MAAQQGFRTQEKRGLSQYQTFQQVGRAGGGSYAADTVQKVLWDTTPLNVGVEAGSTKTIINATAHTAFPGDMIRFSLGSANSGVEVAVLNTTANTIEVAGTLPEVPLTTDEFKIMRWVTPTADQNGNMVFTPGPTTFNRNGLITTVAEDTSNAANNRSLPTLVTFYKDGIQRPVLEDSVTPANNDPLPVKLVGLTGDLNITAGDLNVAVDATNDSIAIGDYVTGEKAKVDLNDDATTYALKVKDDDANALLVSIDSGIAALDTSNLATEATLDDVKIAVESIALEDFATEATLATLATEATLAAVDAKLGDIDDVVNTDGNPAGSKGLMIGGEDTSGDFQVARVNTNGELSVTFGAAGFATETTLTALNNKVANDFGAASGGVRSAAQIGNATGAADFGVGADGAQTLRVSANLKRAGNELSYNSGAADANTLRAVLSTRHESSTTPLAFRPADNTAFIASYTLPASSAGLITTGGQIHKHAAILFGYDSATNQRREIRVDSQGRLLNEPENIPPIIHIQVLTISDAAEIKLDASSSPSLPVLKGFKIMADTENNATVRFKIGIGQTATTTEGMQLQPGRSEDFNGNPREISLIAEAGGSNCKIYIQGYSI